MELQRVEQVLATEHTGTALGMDNVLVYMCVCVCVCVYNTTEYYSAIKINKLESVLMRWMNLEPVIQSEVSQKRKTNILY